MANFIPKSLNLEDIINKVPPYEIKNFKIEKVIYILDLITKIPATNRKVKIENGYVPLKARLLQEKIPDYNKYLKYLERCGIIEIDPYYIPGEKCRGYRFKEPYNGKIALYNPQKKNRKNSILNHRSDETAKAREKYPYLDWFDENFEFDHSSAYQHLDKLKSNYIPKGKTDEQKERNADLYFNSHCRSITDLSEKDYKGKIDDFGYRLHTNLTNLSKEFRQFITYDGQTLASLDFKSSQPNLSTIPLDPNFYKNNLTTNPDFSFTTSTTNYNQCLTYNNLIINRNPYTGEIIHNNPSLNHCIIREKNNINNISRKEILMNEMKIINRKSNDIKLLIESNQIDRKEIEIYKNMISEGTIYENLAEIVLNYLDKDYVKMQYGLNLEIRDEMKKLFYMIVYSSNQNIKGHLAKITTIFKYEFPSVHRVFHEIKKANGKNLVRLLQRIESYLVLDVICKQFSLQYPTIPLFTIHDALITLEHYITPLKIIAENVLEQATGLQPILVEKIWTRSK